MESVRCARRHDVVARIDVGRVHRVGLAPHRGGTDGAERAARYFGRRRSTRAVVDVPDERLRVGNHVERGRTRAVGRHRHTLRRAGRVVDGCP